MCFRIVFDVVVVVVMVDIVNCWDLMGCGGVVDLIGCLSGLE